MNMKCSKCNGFTMVEIIISMALFAILAVGFMALFANSFRMVVETGEQEDVMYNRQSVIEQKIAEQPVATTMPLVITFGGVPVNASGKVYIEDGLTLFVPN